MLEFLLVILIILYLVGYISIPWLYIPDITLFYIGGYAITLWNVIILIVVSWAVSILPSPFRQIIGALIILWVLSTLGIFAIAGLSNLLTLAIILGIVAALFNR